MMVSQIQKFSKIIKHKLIIALKFLVQDLIWYNSQIFQDIYMLETAYPFVPEVGGIDIREILDGYTGARIVRGGSGRELVCQIETNLISVKDRRNSWFVLEAAVERGIASFEVYSKPYVYGSEGREFIDNRHPDLYAGRFVDLAFCHFAQYGVRIDMCRGNWHFGSDNFNVFFDARCQGLSFAESAKRTWSGRKFIEHGFTQITDEEVFISFQNEIWYKIEAYFRRG